MDDDEAYPFFARIVAGLIQRKTVSRSREYVTVQSQVTDSQDLVDSIAVMLRVFTAREGALVFDPERSRRRGPGLYGRVAAHDVPLIAALI